MLASIYFLLLLSLFSAGQVELLLTLSVQYILNLCSELFILMTCGHFY